MAQGGTTPWDIGDQFTRMLAAQTARDYQIGANAQSDVFAAELARQNANTAWGRQVTMDERNFQQSQILADQQRQFTHDENKLINLDYKNATRGRGRAGHILQPGAPAPSGGGGGVMTPQGAYAHLISRGAPPVVAAGIVGNVDAESGWDPAVFSGTRLGDNGTAFGAGQWRNERQQHLFEYARSQGHDRPTPEDQLDFYLVEADSGRDPGAREAMIRASQAQTPEEAADAIMHHYERPADDSTLAQRQAAARSIFDTGSGTQSAPPDPATQTSPSAAPAIETSQRRLYSSTEPQAQPVSTTTQTPDAQIATPSDDAFYQPQRAWTTEDFVANGINNRDLLGIDFNQYDVVDTQFYSGAAIDMMPETMKSLLIPVGGYDPQETNQYLVLQPKANAVKKDAYDQPIDDTGDNNAIGSPPVPVQPPASAAPSAPAPAPAPPTGGAQAAPMPQLNQPNTTNAPSVPVPAAPTGTRTRRNEQGDLEFFVDGQWRSSGG